MRFLMRWTTWFLGGLLLLSSGLLTVQRQVESPLYLMLERIPTSEMRQYDYAYVLAGPDGTYQHLIKALSNRHGNATWFVGWSPDGRTLFYRIMEGHPTAKTGIYAYDVPSGANRLVLEVNVADSRPIDFQLSPDRKHFLTMLFVGRTSLIYVMDVHGNHMRQLTPDNLSSSVAQWSPDSQWIYFVRFDDTSFRNFRTRIDGSITEAVPYQERFMAYAPNNQTRYTLVEGGDTAGVAYVWADGARQTQLTPQNKAFSVLGWLPTNWIILREEPTLSSRDPVGYYRIRPDGTEFSLLATIGKPTDVFWEPNGSAIFFTSLTDIMRVDLVSGDKQFIAENYYPLVTRPSNASYDGEPTSMLWSYSENRLIWKGRVDKTDVYYSATPDGHDTRILYQSAISTVPSLSPDGKWLILANHELRNRSASDPGIIRVRIADAKVEALAPNLAELVAVSPYEDKDDKNIVVLIILGMFMLLLAMTSHRPKLLGQ